MRSMRFGLSRELWVVQIGIFVNALGWGTVLPFEVIYLHNGRGFSLAVAGAVVGLLAAVAAIGLSSQLPEEVSLTPRAVVAS